MPTFSRKTLRQSLGQSYIRDTIVSTTGMSVGGGGVGLVVTRDAVVANAAFSGQNLYTGAMLRIASTDYYVASYNAGSGAFVTEQFAFAAIALGAEYELHQKISATEKDRAIDDTIKRVRTRREVGMMTVDNEAFYSIEGAASPHYVADVLDAYYDTSPDGSLSRGLQRFDDFRLVTTATGRELRVSPVIGGSQQIILDAILQLTLGASDAATINLPDDRWILAGAAAKCYDLMIQNAPGQNAGELANRRKEWAGEFSRLSGHLAPLYERKVRLQEPGE